MLNVLRHIIQEVSDAQDFREALDLVVKRTANALSTEACSIFLFDREQGDYVFVATQGLNKKALGKVRFPFNKGLVGLVGEREEPVNIDDAREHPRFLHIAEIEEEAYRAFLGSPIIYQRQILGVLIVQQREPRRYDEAEEAFLVTLSTQLAAIIAHADATGRLRELFKSKRHKRHELVYSGVPGAPGIGIGMGVVVFTPLDLNTVPSREAEDIEVEIAAANAAFALVREDMRLLSEKLYPSLPSSERALFDVYQQILAEDELGNEVIEKIRAGQWAQGALCEVVLLHAKRLQELDNEYMHERAEDIKDLGRRVLAVLQKNARATPTYAARTVLIGETITPNDLAEVPEGCLAGVISTTGSSNSHVAILARALRVPTVMGMADTPIAELQDKEIIVDGYYGQIYITPNASLRNEFERLMYAEKKLDEALDEIRDLPAVTKDGHRVGLMVNTGLGGADISFALSAGAEGVGLYRTEIPFMMRDRFQSGEEQRIIYRQLLTSFAPRPVIIRTLDVGGDKPLPYFPIKEANPFLGWRGMRITLDHPEIFLSQLRAMLRASEGLDNLRIMLPMITDVTEVDEALRLIRKAHVEVQADCPEIGMPQIGVMIEVPAAVYQSRSLAKRVDFLSVGSNDLTQYILAVDRNNPRVANLYDSLHPAVLRALIQVVENGHQEGKHVSICGEMAGDPVAVILLLAIGFDSFSINASSLSRVRWIIRHFTHKKAAKLLQEVLTMESAVMIRCHMELALERASLGKLIRAGR